MDKFIGEFSSGLFIWQLFLILTVVLWIYCLIDILRNSFKGNDKLIWVLVVLFIPLIGSLLYLAIGRKSKI